MKNHRRSIFFMSGFIIAPNSYVQRRCCERFGVVRRTRIMVEPASRPQRSVKETAKSCSGSMRGWSVCTLMSSQFRWVVFCLCYCCVTIQAFHHSLCSRTTSSSLPSTSLWSAQEDSDADGITRRTLLSSSAGCVLSTLLLPDTALASPPITAKDTDSLLAQAQRARRPKPPKVLRRKLSLDFAVLLMRSSYNALDEIDCVAMDQFQRDFFLIRSSEYQNYVGTLGPGMVQQGDLTDPYYFDFISYAQYTTINREATVDPPLVFTEQQPVDMGPNEPNKFVPVVIKRDPIILPNDQLVPEHGRRVGRKVLEKLEEIFSPEGLFPKLEPNSRPDSDKILEALKKLANLFLISGFAFGSSVEILGRDASSIDASGSQFRVTLNAPANLWSGKCLQQQGSPLLNDFYFKAARELLFRAGYGIASSSVKYEGSSEETTFTLR